MNKRRQTLWSNSTLVGILVTLTVQRCSAHGTARQGYFAHLRSRSNLENERAFSLCERSPEEQAVPAKKIQPVERAAPFDLDQHVTPFISTRFRVMTVTK